MSNQRSRRAPGHGGHGPMGMGAGEKAKDFKGTFGKLVNTLKPFLVSVIVVFVFAVASTVFSIAGPKILGSATNINWWRGSCSRWRTTAWTSRCRRACNCRGVPPERS